jgi:putative hydrolase of the HAD superfamily
MSVTTPTHLLLDFFGTLVEYSPSRTEQGYHTTHNLIRTLGAGVSYEAFLNAWLDSSSRLDRRSDLDDSEYSMLELATAVVEQLLDRRPTSAEISAVVDSYLAEWNTAVIYPMDTAPTIATLAESFRLAVVTNTHQQELVPCHLEAMGIAHQIDIVITSVEVGWRKPHPAIYGAALERLGIEASRAVFVGDNHTADYLGPRAVGISALLLDPRRTHAIPSQDRLHSLAELPNHLS